MRHLPVRHQSIAPPKSVVASIVALVLLMVVVYVVVAIADA